MFQLSSPSKLMTTGLVGCIALLGAVRAGATPPPGYAVTPLDSFEDWGTSGNALNSLGQTTGDSGYPPHGNHAFLGSPDGTIVNIETLTCDRSMGNVINDAGQVAGYYTIFVGSDTLSYPYRYTPGVGMVDLGLTVGSHYSIVDINDSGDVLGMSVTGSPGNTVQHGYVYTDADGLVDLGALGDYNTTPRDINAAGQVVGYSWTPDFHIHAFLWQDGVMQDLGTLGGDWSEAYYISSDGVVVGEARTADGVMHAFRYTVGSGMEQLPAPAGTTSCAATWVTDSGMITGWWQDQDFRQRAFYYTDAEGTVDIGMEVGPTGWTGPVAANDAGEILIWVLDETNYEVFPYHYSSETGPHDLNKRLTVDLDWKLDTPIAINDAGQILASGFDVNRYRTVLLTPVTPGDLNGDGAVDISDLGQMLPNYGVTSDANYAMGDIDGDGDVDIGDLGELLAVYGTL